MAIDLILRAALPKDSEFAYRVKKAAFREYVEAVWGWDEEAQRRIHEKSFDPQHMRIVIADGEDVGTLTTIATGDRLDLKQLFILPERQGEGIGRECMALAMEEARRLGLPVRLQVLRVNPRALEFYERLGFARAGETETHYLTEKTP